MRLNINETIRFPINCNNAVDNIAYQIAVCSERDFPYP